MLISLRFLTLVLCLVSLTGQTFTQFGAPGEKKGKGMVVLRAAQIIDGTGAAPLNDGDRCYR